MKIIDTTTQGSEAWDQWRSVRPTASEYSKIITGTGKISGQRETYMRRLAIARQYPLPKWTGNAHTDRGHELEPVARDKFIEMTGLDVRKAAFIDHETTIAGGSPDGIIYNAQGQPVSGLEIKCFNTEKHLTILEKGEIPTDMRPQVNGHLWLSGFKSWICCFYCPEAFPFDIRCFEVTPDSYTDQLGKEVTKFCDELNERADEFIADFERAMGFDTLSENLPVLMVEVGKVETPQLEELEESII